MVPGQAGFLGPPAQVLLAAPFALLPEQAAVQLWTAVDAAALAAALYLLDRHLRLRGAARAFYWLLAAWFPPLFAELDAGQRGGAILLAALAALALAGTRPVLAGIAGGAAGALKLYPLALAIGAPGGVRARFWTALGATAALLSAAGFALLGSPWQYLTGVLIPAATVHTPDCAITSVPSLWQRTLGGAAYALPGPGGGLALHRAPLDQPALAEAITLAVAAVLIAGVLWTARRTGWDPSFAMLAGLALGAVLPGEVYPYQWLPLLPLTLAVAAGLADRRRWPPLALLGILLLGFTRQPCDLPWPNLWTLAGLAVFGVCLWHHRLFPRTEPGGPFDGDQ